MHSCQEDKVLSVSSPAVLAQRCSLKLPFIHGFSSTLSKMLLSHQCICSGFTYFFSVVIFQLTVCKHPLEIQVIRNLTDHNWLGTGPSAVLHLAQSFLRAAVELSHKFFFLQKMTACLPYMPVQWFSSLTHAGGCGGKCVLKYPTLAFSK